MTTYPVWVSAGTNDLRVEVEHSQFVDYVRVAGVWRQQTRPMTGPESVTPARCWIGDWRAGATAWPEVDAAMAAWLDTTMKEVSR